MQDPKQLYLFNYMDKEYDDMESDDYNEAYWTYYMSTLSEQTDDFDSLETE